MSAKRPYNTLYDTPLSIITFHMPLSHVGPNTIITILITTPPPNQARFGEREIKIPVLFRCIIYENA